MINGTVMRKETMTSKKRETKAASWEGMIFMGKRRNKSSHKYIIFMGTKFMKKYFFLHMGEKNYTIQY